MGRREFIATSAGVVTAGLGVACGRAASMEEIEQAAAQVGRLPVRPLGRSGRNVSVLIGTATWSADAVEAGIRCGINYWHKADRWTRRSLPQGILKNREAHYCEICVDRVRGNHETGEIDEEAHYRFVKQTVEQSGLGYFDDLMFHFGYHNLAEVRGNQGFIRLFERLKKERLVRHLCLSQHNYNGNRRVPGGESAATILPVVMEGGIYEHAQFFYSYGDSEAINNFVKAAKAKGFGTTAMKTTRGASRLLKDPEFAGKLPPGTTPHNALARWLTTSTDLTTAVIQINSLREFVDTYSGAGKPLRTADLRTLELVAEYADREVCRLCNDCVAHCPQGLAIADILRYERYAQDYGEMTRARRLYAELDRRADDCVVCGTCLPHCPQGLNIPEKLAGTHRMLG